VLTEKQAIDKAKELLGTMKAEREVLDDIRRYWIGCQSLPRVIPRAAPAEVYAMARMSRVNVISIVMESLGQSLFVEGFRGKTDADNAPVWDIWQRNRLDARQSGIHRASLAYGTGYATVLPGEPVPVIRGLSPRALHAVYSVDDPDWPVYALERRADKTYRLLDETTVYTLSDLDSGKAVTLIGTAEHMATEEGRPVTPVVRFREVEDLDLADDVSNDIAAALETYTEESTGLTITRSSTRRVSAIGQVGPLMSIQDQVDVITFNLLVAMHFAAFRQRYIMGWTGPDEIEQLGLTGEELKKARREAVLSASAARVWTFDDKDVEVGEFSETSLEGYIKAREASLRHAASLSQTPAHELIGELVNLSAEALAAAEAGRDRKVASRETMLGESHEQMLRLAGSLAKIEVSPDAQMVWRNTSARSFAATVDALGKLSTMLGVPASELWERIPGVSQQDVERWKAQAVQGDAFSQLTDVLNRQANPGASAPPAVKAVA
jgi:hypothetical protein